LKIFNPTRDTNISVNFSNTTVQWAYFTSSDGDDDDFIPDKGYDDDDLFQDDKEEDL
jgi:hypothetical protein